MQPSKDHAIPTQGSCHTVGCPNEHRPLPRVAYKDQPMSGAPQDRPLPANMAVFGQRDLSFPGAQRARAFMEWSSPAVKLLRQGRGACDHPRAFGIQPWHQETAVGSKCDGINSLSIGEAFAGKQQNGSHSGHCEWAQGRAKSKVELVQVKTRPMAVTALFSLAGIARAVCLAHMFLKVDHGDKAGRYSTRGL